MRNKNYSIHQNNKDILKNNSSQLDQRCTCECNCDLFNQTATPVKYFNKNKSSILEDKYISKSKIIENGSQTLKKVAEISFKPKIKEFTNKRDSPKSDLKCTCYEIHHNEYNLSNKSEFLLNKQLTNPVKALKNLYNANNNTFIDRSINANECTCDIKIGRPSLINTSLQFDSNILSEFNEPIVDEVSFFIIKKHIICFVRLNKCDF
jgi:hypothetical protein